MAKSSWSLKRGKNQALVWNQVLQNEKLGSLKDNNITVKNNFHETELNHQNEIIKNVHPKAIFLKSTEPLSSKTKHG